jgi:hypothetical protein
MTNVHVHCDGLKCPKPNVDVKPTGPQWQTFDAVKSLKQPNMEIQLIPKLLTYNRPVAC